MENPPPTLEESLGLPPRPAVVVEPEPPWWDAGAAMTRRRFLCLLAVPLVPYLGLTAWLADHSLDRDVRLSIEAVRSAVAVLGAGFLAFLLQARFRYLRVVESVCSDLVKLADSVLRVNGDEKLDKHAAHGTRSRLSDLHAGWAGIVAKFRYWRVDYPVEPGTVFLDLLFECLLLLRDGKVVRLTDEQVTGLCGALLDVANAVSMETRSEDPSPAA